MKQIMKVATGMIVSSAIFAGSAFAQATPRLSDPEIASVAVVANQIDINAAKLAKEKSRIWSYRCGNFNSLKPTNA